MRDRAGWGAFSSFLNLFILSVSYYFVCSLCIQSGSLFTLQPYPTVLAEVNIYPGGRGKWANGSFFNPLVFLGSLFTLLPYPTIIAGVPFTLQDSLPCFACIKANIHIRLLSLCHVIINI
jgi:hypothetical protein